MKDPKGKGIFGGGMGATGKSKKPGKSFKKLYPGNGATPGRNLSDMEGGARRGVGHKDNFGNKHSGTKIHVTSIRG